MEYFAAALDDARYFEVDVCLISPFVDRETIIGNLANCGSYAFYLCPNFDISVIPVLKFFFSGQI